MLCHIVSQLYYTEVEGVHTEEVTWIMHAGRGGGHAYVWCAELWLDLAGLPGNGLRQVQPATHTP